MASLKAKAWTAPPLVRTKRSFDGAAELRPVVLKCQFLENRRNRDSPIPLGTFGNRIPLALFLLINLGRGTVPKAVGFFAFEKSFISYHSSPILARKLCCGRYSVTSPFGSGQAAGGPHVKRVDEAFDTNVGRLSDVDHPKFRRLT
jgi:hypothetical protein